MDKETWKENAHKTKDDVKENLKKAKKTRVALSIAKLTLLIGIVIAVPLYIFFYQHDYIEQFKSFEDVLNYLERYRFESIFIYISIQVIQIVISVIPDKLFSLPQAIFTDFCLDWPFPLSALFWARPFLFIWPSCWAKTPYTCSSARKRPLTLCSGSTASGHTPSCFCCT